MRVSIYLSIYLPVCLSIYIIYDRYVDAIRISAGIRGSHPLGVQEFLGSKLHEVVRTLNHSKDERILRLGPPEQLRRNTCSSSYSKALMSGYVVISVVGANTHISADTHTPKPQTLNPEPNQNIMQQGFQSSQKLSLIRQHLVVVQNTCPRNGHDVGSLTLNSSKALF